MPERRLVISDASPLIALADIGRLELLQALYDTVYITDVVRLEINANLPSWILISDQYDKKICQSLQLQLDPGEASAIALH